MNESVWELKDVTSLKHPLKVYMNLWGLLGSCHLHDCSYRGAQAITAVCLPERVCVRLSSPDLQLESLHATFSRLSTRLKGSSGHSSNVCSQLQTLVACLGFFLDKPQTLEPGVTTWNRHDKCVDYFYLIVTHLKTTRKSKRSNQDFQVWKAKG